MTRSSTTTSPDSTVRLSRVRAGDLDIAERIAPTDLKTVREDANLALHAGQGLAVSHLMFNVGNGDKADTPLGKNEKLRQAFELAIDRNVINRVAFNGEFLADNQMIPPSSPFYSKAHKAPARDVAKAKALIAAAGMTRVPVELTYENALTDGRVAQIVQSMAGEAGFDVKLLPLETASAIERYLNGNFEMYIGNWSGRADPDPTLFSFFGCTGSQNVNKYCNKDLDGVLTEARGEADEAKRAALYEKATDIYLTALSSIPIYHPNWFFAARKSRRRRRDVSRRPAAPDRREADELTPIASWARAPRPGQHDAESGTRFSDNIMLQLTEDGAR